MTNPFSETTTCAYLSNYWLQKSTLSNGTVTTYTHNPLGQLSEIASKSSTTTLSDYASMIYDGVGNRTSWNATIPQSSMYSGLTNYNYDNRNQLTSEQSTRNGSYTNNFVYDGISSNTTGSGNPTTFRNVSGLTYNSNNQANGITYDGDGNPNARQGSTLSFDAENRLTAYGNIMVATYDQQNLRVSKQTSAGTKYFLYDDNRHPICEFNASGSLVATNTFSANGLVSRRTMGISIFYTFDPQGNVAQRLNNSGNVTNSSLFDGFGYSAAPGTSANDPFGFGAEFGYYTDAETGLQLLTYRYYDSTNGRFINRDPIGNSGGINIYSYAQNNSINHDDPTGLKVYDCDRPIFPWWMGCFNTHNHRHWFLIVDTCTSGTTEGYMGWGPNGIYNYPGNNTAGYPLNGYQSSCKELLNVSPAQEKCLCDNFHAAQAGSIMCGYKWVKPGITTYGAENICQSFVNCLFEKCQLPVDKSEFGSQWYETD